MFLSSHSWLGVVAPHASLQQTQRAAPMGLALSVVVVMGLALGCSEEKKASATATKRSARGSTERSVATPVPVGAETGSVRDVERGSEVEILEVEWDPKVQAVLNPGYRFVAVRLRVKSTSEKMRLHLRPDRFSLRTQQGARFPPLQSTRVDPLLPTVFLRRDDTVEGWLTFRFPEDEVGLEFVSDLSVPPILLPLGS